MSTLHPLLQLIGKNHTHLAWISLPVQEWKGDNYKNMELCVVNDPAEVLLRQLGTGSAVLDLRRPSRPPSSPLTSSASSPQLSRKSLKPNLEKMLKMEDVELKQPL